MMMLQINGFLKHAERDIYDQGCAFDDGFSSDVSISFTAPDWPSLKAHVLSFFDAIEDSMEINACDEDGRIDIQRMEDADGLAPTERQIDQWKRGELDLWTVTYTGYVQSVSPFKIEE